MTEDDIRRIVREELAAARGPRYDPRGAATAAQDIRRIEDAFRAAARAVEAESPQASTPPITNGEALQRLADAGARAAEALRLIPPFRRSPEDEEPPAGVAVPSPHPSPTQPPVRIEIDPEKLRGLLATDGGIRAEIVRLVMGHMRSAASYKR